MCIVIVSMAANLLTSSQPLPDFGLDPIALKTTSPNSSSYIGHSFNQLAERGHYKETFLSLLPVSVLAFEKPPWDQLMPKVIRILLVNLCKEYLTRLFRYGLIFGQKYRHIQRQRTANKPQSSRGLDFFSTLLNFLSLCETSNSLFLGVFFHH